MTQGSRRAIVLAACVVLTGTTVALAQSAPRPVIDRTNCDTVTDLLPASVLAWVKKGDLTLVLGQLSYEPGWEPAFLAASEANAGRYDVDAEGGLIDRSSGARPDHTYGLPFARIDPAEPKSGVQVMWNVSFIFLKTGALRVPFIFDWIGRNGFERVVNGEAAGFPFDGQPMAVPNPDRTEQRQLFRAVGPASIDGSATLTWRYMDDRPDMVWGYLPALRRVRQLTAANRSDPLFGSDFVQDDGLMWVGRNQSFEWKLVGHQEVLVPTAAIDLVPLVAGRRGPLGQEWKTPGRVSGCPLGVANAGVERCPLVADQHGMGEAARLDRGRSSKRSVLQLRQADLLRR
ncbi:MAG TPA: DUF1329 domain-containing protein [Candidatus Acidoferrales bacterium]|nr:DUF1329 domain-containing protein [Candidatus Acidoferrales bacterium]